MIEQAILNVIDLFKDPEELPNCNNALRNELKLFFDCMEKGAFVDAFEVMTRLDSIESSIITRKYLSLLSGFLKDDIGTIGSDEGAPGARVAIVFGQIRNTEYLNNIVASLASRFDVVIVSTWKETGRFVPHNQQTFESLFSVKELEILNSNKIDFSTLKQKTWEELNDLILPELNLSPRGMGAEEVSLSNSYRNVFLLKNEVPEIILRHASNDIFLLHHINQIRMSYLLAEGSIFAKKLLSKQDIVIKSVHFYRPELVLRERHIDNAFSIKAASNSVYVDFIPRSKFTRIGDFSYFGGGDLLDRMVTVFDEVTALADSNERANLRPHAWIVDFFISQGVTVKINPCECYGRLQR